MMIVFARYENHHKESRWTKRPRYSDCMIERRITTPWLTWRGVSGSVILSNTE
jgi:hypothetical protein